MLQLKIAHLDLLYDSIFYFLSFLLYNFWEFKCHIIDTRFYQTRFTIASITKTLKNDQMKHERSFICFISQKRFTIPFLTGSTSRLPASSRATASSMTSLTIKSSIFDRPASRFSSSSSRATSPFLMMSSSLEASSSSS